jgi:signal transduction histidine kinase
MLLRRETTDPWQAKTAARILSSADRAHRMIRDLLDFTQARLSGGIPVRAGPMDLHDIAQHVVEETRIASPDRDIQVEFKGDGRGEWDADRIAQVLTNLVSNALAYSPQGTPVRVELRDEGDAVVASVQNQGTPIAPELLPRLFEPLTRGQRQGRDKGSRSIGLGLYIVDHIVRAHGGTVGVRSSAEEGTTFTVHLPRRPAGPATP